MNVNDVMRLLDAKLICGEENLETEVHEACGSDMMSDVLAYVKDQAVLLTGLVNIQTVRTADMMDMVCIVFVRGKQRQTLRRYLVDSFDIIHFAYLPSVVLLKALHEIDQLLHSLDRHRVIDGRSHAADGAVSL